MSLGYHEERYYSTPSEERGKVANWIIWPSILGAICGLAMFSGIGVMFATFYNVDTRPVIGWPFVIGCGAFGAGLAGLTTIMVKSLSFDSSPKTNTIRKTPVMMQPQDTPQELGGNRAVTVPSSNAHIVEWGNHKFNFTNEQLRHLIDRYEDKATKYRITRDNANGRKMFTDWALVKSVMDGAGLWMNEKGKMYWTEEGGKWLESRMRMITV